MIQRTHSGGPYQTDTSPVIRSPGTGAHTTGDKENMDIVAYWQKSCAPYLRALFGRRTERGAALVEYALLLALIAVVCIVALTTLGKQASSTFTETGNSIAGT